MEAIDATTSGQAQKEPSSSCRDRPVAFAVVSTAEIAENKVIPGLLAVKSTILAGVSSRNKDRAQAFVDKTCQGCSGITGMTHDEIFSSSPNTIDAVYVPLPSRVRHEFLAKSLENGKHVYSEKPHGGTINEFKTLLDLAAAKNLQWIDGTMWYHSNRTKAMEDLLFKAKSLGKVRRVSASFTWGGGGLVDEKWKEGGNGRTDPKRELMGMLGDSGHYPVSAAAWAFGWELPTKVQATYTKRNLLGAIVEIEAFLWFSDGGRAVVDASCELPHRSLFEVVCEKGVIKVDDLVGGQGRTGNFAAYEGPFVGSSSFVVGNHLGKDTVVSVEACDHVQSLIQEFSASVQRIRDHGGKSNPEWSKRSLCTHTILCAIFESAMRDGMQIKLVTSQSKTSYVIEGESFGDLPTKDWNGVDAA